MAVDNINNNKKNINEKLTPLCQKSFVPDRFGLLGLLSVIRMTDQDLNTLALGTDLTTLGLNLNSPEYVCLSLISLHPHCIDIITLN